MQEQRTESAVLRGVCSSERSGSGNVSLEIKQEAQQDYLLLGGLCWLSTCL